MIGEPHPRTGETVVAFVVPRPGAHPDPVELLRHAGRRLARYKLPTRVEVVDELPRIVRGQAAAPRAVVERQHRRAAATPTTRRRSPRRSPRSRPRARSRTPRRDRRCPGAARRSTAPACPSAISTLPPARRPVPGVREPREPHRRPHRAAEHDDRADAARRAGERARQRVEVVLADRDAASGGDRAVDRRREHHADREAR